MNAVVPKRSHHKKKPDVVEVNGTKPKLGLPDPLEAAQEAARHAQEGNRKLSLAVDALRTALETITVAEIDHETGLPVSARDLRQLAVDGLDAYSQITGQNWRSPRNRIVATRVGDRNLGKLSDEGYADQ